LEESTTSTATAEDSELEGMIHLQNVGKQLPEQQDVATRKTKIHHPFNVQTFHYENVPETLKLIQCYNISYTLVS
jgi:hypothetical protein